MMYQAHYVLRKHLCETLNCYLRERPAFGLRPRYPNPVWGKYSETRNYIGKTLELKLRFEAFSRSAEKPKKPG